jgi:hypothetical protein
VAAAQQVQMEMVDGLTAFHAGVRHDAVTLGEAFFAGDLRCDPEQMAEQVALAFAGLMDRANVFAGDDEDVDRRLRIDVGKGVDAIVLKDSGRRDFAPSDLAEDATHSVNQCS